METAGEQRGLSQSRTKQTQQIPKNTEANQSAGVKGVSKDKPATEIRPNKSQTKAQSTTRSTESGSRFSVLNEQGMDVNMEEEEDDQPHQVGSQIVEPIGVTHDAGKDESEAKTLDDEGMDIEELILSVSHEELAKSIKPLFRRGHVERIKVVGPNTETKRTKERPLREITNKLVAQPAILKPNWAGSRQAFDKPSKSPFTLSGKLPVGTDQERMFAFPPNPLVCPGKVARVECQEPRPPDPTHPTGHLISPANPKAPFPTSAPNSTVSFVELQAEARRDEEDAATQDERWSGCRSEEAMDISTPTTQ